MTPTERDIEKARRIYLDNFIFDPGKSHVDDNVRHFAEALAQERSDTEKRVKKETLESPQIKALVEVLEQAQPQTGKKTRILTEGSEEINAWLIPSFDIQEALSAFNALKEKLK